MSGFLEDFRIMSTFGATAGGGVDRQAATTADGETRAWFQGWLAAHGFTVEIDGIGNIFGMRELVPGAPWILAGSHLDSQPLAGRFDGAYGVLAAAHAAQSVSEAVAAGDVVPRYNIAVVDWFNEEGSRFKPSMMGSAVYTGLLPLDEALGTTDPAGTSVAAALDAIDGRGGFTGIPVAAYVEIHVEQGRALEEAGAVIGPVADTWTARKIELIVRGEQAHTGAAQMRDRRDALYGAARVVVAVRDLIDAFEAEQLHTAVSELHLEPNSPVAIAREVRLLADVRAPDRGILDDAVTRLQGELEVIAESARVDIEIERVVEWSSGPFDERGLALIEEIAAAHGHATLRVPTVAGHDATNMKERVPTLLMFVPSVDGLSHNERELTSDADMLAGLEVLSGVLSRLIAGESTIAEAS